VASHQTWYDTGEVYQSRDPLGHTTTYTYDSVFGAYVTQTCSPSTGSVSHCVSGSYDTPAGLLTSFTDQNTQTTNYDYDAPTYRLKSATLPPDAGNSNARAVTSFAYSSSTAPTTFPFTVTRNSSITSTLSDSSTSTYDGLARIIKTQHAMPSGTPSTVGTAYDLLGRVATVTNPNFTSADSTYGIITNSYDPLDRVTSVKKQDGSITGADYGSGNCIVNTDEAGHQRESCSDALGRLVEVLEPNPGAVATNATGWVAISGLERSATSQPATNASLTVTLGGFDSSNSSTICGINGCRTTNTKDTGRISFTLVVAGVTIGPVTATYNGIASAANLATTLYNNFRLIPLSP
jgi:YD repeat-containing protein